MNQRPTAAIPAPARRAPRRGLKRRPEVPIPRDPDERARLAEFAGLTPEERAALDQWCYDQQEAEQAAGVPPRRPR